MGMGMGRNALVVSYNSFFAWALVSYMTTWCVWLWVEERGESAIYPDRWEEMGGGVFVSTGERRVQGVEGDAF